MSIGSFQGMSVQVRLWACLGLTMALLCAAAGSHAQSSRCTHGCDCGVGYCVRSGYPGAHYGEFDSTWCDFVYSPTAYDATPTNLVVGQVRCAFVPNDTCPCADVAGIGDTVLASPSLDTDWEEAEYYTYCNPCVPSE